MDRVQGIRGRDERDDVIRCRAAFDCDAGQCLPIVPDQIRRRK